MRLSRMQARLPTGRALDLVHVEWCAITALFAFDQGASQRLDPVLVLLEQPQAGAHDFAGVAVAACLGLFADEALEVVVERDAGVLRHGEITPNFTKRTLAGVFRSRAPPVSSTGDSPSSRSRRR